MTNEEIKNKAKETSGGNYYYEQGFIYGFELGEEAGYEQATKRAYERQQDLTDTYIKDDEKLETIKELVTDYDMCRYNKDNFINKVMSVIKGVDL